MLHKVSIAGLTIDPASNTPILILKSSDDRSIPIWIGVLEATSIASVIQKVKFDRPMTHDLFKNLIEVLNITVAKIEVCDIRDNTFYAKIYFISENKNFIMDARPSDAIAIALRCKAPIYVDDKVIKKANSLSTSEPGEPVDKSEEGEKWAEYLESLDAKDFGKYKI